MANPVDCADKRDPPLSPSWIGALAVALDADPSGAQVQESDLAAIKGRLMERVRLQAQPRHFQLLQADGWRVVDSQVQVKALRNDGATLSWLVQLQPGTRFQAHAHDDGDEECMVLQGSVVLDGCLFRAGDYTMAKRGSNHLEVFSAEGCVLFLKSPASQALQMPELQSIG